MINVELLLKTSIVLNRLKEFQTRPYEAADRCSNLTGFPLAIYKFFLLYLILLYSLDAYFRSLG